MFITDTIFTKKSQIRKRKKNSFLSGIFGFFGSFFNRKKKVKKEEKPTVVTKKKRGKK